MSSKLNKSSTPLDADSSFVGDFDFIHPHQGVSVIVNTDVDGVVKYHFSNDAGTTIDFTDEFNVSGNAPFYKSVVSKGKWFKAEYINGGVAQTSFKLSTLYKLDAPDAEFDSDDVVGSKQSGVWSVAVNNLPATQSVSGSVVVSSGDITETNSDELLVVSNDISDNTLAISDSAVSLDNKVVYCDTGDMSGSVVVTSQPHLDNANDSVSATITNTSLSVVNNNLDSLTFDASNNLNVNLSTPLTIDVSLSSNNDSVQCFQSNSSNFQTQSYLMNDGLEVSSSNPLPTENAIQNLGTHNNLFDNVAVTGSSSGTESQAVDVSKMRKGRILSSGSDTSSYNSYDILFSPDGVNYYNAPSSVYLINTNGGGGSLPSRQSVTEVDLAGIKFIKLVCFDTETVNATVVGSN